MKIVRMTMLVLAALALVLPGTPARAGRLQVVSLLEPAAESLMTPETEVRARWSSPEAPSDIRMVEYWFTTAGGREVDLGDSSAVARQGFGPHCERGPCEVTPEFWGDLDGLRSTPEGWGTLAVRLPGQRTDQDSVRVYWDPTPPKAAFVSPSFADSIKPAYVVVLQTPDENITKITVHFKLFDDPNRNVPPVEQHATGYLLTSGGHASCVPAAVAANMKWLDQTGQADVVPNGMNDVDLVTAIGVRMGTMGGGTSGAGAIDGTEDWLADQGYDPAFPYYDSDADHDYVPAGLHPNSLAGYMSQGYAVNLGIHNLSGDAGFGHYVALDNINVLANGTAFIRVMDPNIEPPGSPTGAYRTFVMQPDGTIPWSNAAIGYGNPASGKMRIDEILAVGEFDGWPSAGDARGGGGGGGGGEVTGVLLPDGHTWVGVFTPPAGQGGPWILTSEATDAAGMAQLSHLVIGT